MPEREPIFITGRFRSGSTMLWSFYDRASGYRAYYEPCHDSLLAHIHATSPMASHVGVEDYWSCYRAKLGDVERLHRPDFGLCRLHLEADDVWPELEAYLRALCANDGSVTSVLQFNRVDLRLGWLRERFPEARVLHLWRDARRSWFSLTRHLPDVWEDDPDAPHVYDLLEWSFSLSDVFPFLADPAITSLYERHYLLWKLSRLQGERRAHLSLCYDTEFAGGQATGVDRLLEAGLLHPRAAGVARESIMPRLPGRPLERFVPHEGFDAIEARCESRLDALGLNASFGITPLREIREAHADAWREAGAIAREPIRAAMLRAYSQQRSEVTRLLHEVRGRR